MAFLDRVIRYTFALILRNERRQIFFLWEHSQLTVLSIFRNKFRDDPQL